MKITRHGFAIIEGDTHLGKWAEESGRLDHDQSALPQVLPFIPIGGIVVDVGANIGTHTIAYARKADRVFAFEPFPPAYECLEHNMKSLHNVEIFKIALGSKKGKAKIACTNENYGMASISEEGEEIEVNTLDSLFKSKIDFIKIDAEGFEIEILEGGKNAIGKSKPVMYIEVNEHTLRLKGHTKQDLLDRIEGLGYSYRNIYPGHGFEDDQFDVICFPK